MKHWKTPEIMEKLISIPGASILKSPCGGDVDTSEVIVKRKGYAVHVAGFVTQGDIVDPDDADVEMVEITDGKDSRGGCNVTTADGMKLYSEVKIIITEAGFLTVDSMDEYF